MRFWSETANVSWISRLGVETGGNAFLLDELDDCLALALLDSRLAHRPRSALSVISYQTRRSRTPFLSLSASLSSAHTRARGHHEIISSIPLISLISFYHYLFASEWQDTLAPLLLRT